MAKGERGGAVVAAIGAVIAEPSGEIPADAVAQYMALQLEEYYRKFGEDRFHEAANKLVPPPAHRKKKDLTLQIALARALYANKFARSLKDAARKATDEIRDKHDRRKTFRNVYDRLRKGE